MYAVTMFVLCVVIVPSYNSDNKTKGNKRRGDATVPATTGRDLRESEAAATAQRELLPIFPSKIMSSKKKENEAVHLSAESDDEPNLYGDRSLVSAGRCKRKCARPKQVCERRCRRIRARQKRNVCNLKCTDSEYVCRDECRAGKNTCFRDCQATAKSRCLRRCGRTRAVVRRLRCTGGCHERLNPKAETCYVDRCRRPPPTAAPTDAPTDSTGNLGIDPPTPSPSESPPSSPSKSPSKSPSQEPSESPSDVPSMEPSGWPSMEPSDLPSFEPSEEPSEAPSLTVDANNHDLQPEPELRD